MRRHNHWLSPTATAVTAREPAIVVSSAAHPVAVMAQIVTMFRLLMDAAAVVIALALFACDRPRRPRASG